MNFTPELKSFVTREKNCFCAVLKKTFHYENKKMTFAKYDKNAVICVQKMLFNDSLQRHYFLKHIDCTNETDRLEYVICIRF